MNYMVIDVTTLTSTKIEAVASLHAAPLIAKIIAKQERQLIAPPVEGRGLAKLTAEQLQYLYWNHVGEVPPSEYDELVKACLAIAKGMPVDATPLATLEAEVRRLYPDEPTAKPSGEKKERAPGEAPERPKATSTTGLVWDLADQQFSILHPSGDASTADWKIIRAGVMDACETEGINPATAATQYSKWKAAKLASKAA